MTGLIYILLQWHGDGMDTEIKVGTESWPSGRKFFCHSCWDLNLQHFDHESVALPLSCPCSTTELSLLYHWAIPALPLSCPCSTTELSLPYHWAVPALPLSCPCSTTELSLLYHRAIPALPLNYPSSTTELSLLYHWTVPALPLSCPCSTTELSCLALILICILIQGGSMDLNIEGFVLKTYLICFHQQVII